MPLPTRSDVLTLDFTGYGQPAAYIEAKTLSPSSATLDYTLAGQPAFGLPDGAVTLLPSLYSNANTFYAATVDRGAVTLLPSLYINANTFYAATVDRGAVTLLPSLYINANTFYAATVTGKAATQTLLPSLYNNDSAFYAATVDRGAVTLLPSLYSNANTFYAATVDRGAVTLLPSLYINANTFYAATVTRIGQPVHATGTVKRRRFKPVILSDLFVIKSTNGAIAVSGFDVSLSLTKLMAFGETVIPASATIRQHEIISEDIPVRAFSNWNDPTDDELKLILDFALGDNSLIDLCHSLMVLSRPMESYETTDGMKVE